MTVERFLGPVSDRLSLPLAELRGGFSSPLAVEARSIAMEEASRPFIEEIKQERDQWKERLAGGWLDYRDELSHLLGTASSDERENNGLRQQWLEIAKGGREEEQWTRRTVGLAAALFEKLQQEKGKENFQLRDNQLYFISLLVLNKGSYSFAGLESDNRGVQLPTGEGKTYAYGLAAAVLALRGEKVVVCEPNHTSAMDHLGQMGEFFYRFLNNSRPASALTDRRKERKKEQGIEVVVDSDGLLKEKRIDPDSQRSFVYTPDFDNRQLASINPQFACLQEYDDKDGRRRAYNCPIIYSHKDALAFDWLEDHQISQQQERAQPCLENLTVVVTEGDFDLVDEASTPYIISEVLKEEETWKALADILEVDRLFAQEVDQPERKLLTQYLTFGLWQTVELLDPRAKSSGFEAAIVANYNREAGKKGWSKVDRLKEIFVKGLGEDYLSSEDQLNVDDRFQEKMKFVLRHLFMPLLYLTQPEGDYQWFMDKQDYLGFAGNFLINAHRKMRAFGQDQERFPSPCRAEVLKKAVGGLRESVIQRLDQWIEDHWSVILEACRIKLVMKEERDYLSGAGEDPVLLSSYGFPLESRKLQLLSSVFLQLKTGWDKWFHQVKPGEEGRALERLMRGQGRKELALSLETDRIMPVVLFKQFKTLRFGSGSLLPASRLFNDLYQADVVSVSRHEPLPWLKTAEEYARENTLAVPALDGGPAEIDFFADFSQLKDGYFARIKELREGKRMALLIVSDLQQAEDWRQLLNQRGVPQEQIKMVTARQEADQPGAMSGVCQQGEPGTVFITTWMVHRDTDWKIPPQVQQAGGAEVLLVGPLPTERGFWQALSRVGRGDIFGSRRVGFCPQLVSQAVDRPLWQAQAGLFTDKKRSYRRNQAYWDSLFKRALLEKEQGRWFLTGSRELGTASLNKGKSPSVAKRERLFKEIIKFLQLREEDINRQLIHLLIRDQQLPQLKERYLQAFDQAVDRERVISSLMEKGFPYLRFISPLKGEEKMVRANFLGGLKMPRSTAEAKLLRIFGARKGWQDFLNDLEEEFFQFTLNPLNRGEAKDLLVKWRAHLQGFFEKKMKSLGQYFVPGLEEELKKLNLLT